MISNTIFFFHQCLIFSLYLSWGVFTVCHALISIPGNALGLIKELYSQICLRRYFAPFSTSSLLPCKMLQNVHVLGLSARLLSLHILTLQNMLQMIWNWCMLFVPTIVYFLIKNIVSKTNVSCTEIQKNIPKHYGLYGSCLESN